MKPHIDIEALDFADTITMRALTPEQLARGKLEAETGGGQLRKSGYLVSITRQAAQRIPPKNGAKYVMLVIEDDPDLAQVLIDIFMMAEYEVRWAANKTEANTELRRGDMDVLLLDVVLPDADGLQILQRLRDLPKFENLPVIMMTGKSTAQDVGAGLAAGADGYVTKPFVMSGLLKAVADVLGNPAPTP